ncbi:MAG: CehA/McbA family metallohydrolase [Gemmatimonadetes bacterium]|nr:CehA/McbA family metallohydrolase [Gemmatimonadota bacterium]
MSNWRICPRPENHRNHSSDIGMHIEIVVLDALTRKELAARLSFRGDGLPDMWGKDAAGKDMAYLGSPRIWCDGTWKGDLPDVSITVVVSRPYEYKTQVVDIEPGDQQKWTILLERGCCPTDEGWFAGDAHQHVVHGEAMLAVNLPTATLVSKAEGVSWMVYDADARFTSVENEPEPSVDDLNSLCASASDADFLALWADEYPKHDLGHLVSFPMHTPAQFRPLAGEGIYRLEEGMRTPYLNFESIRVLRRHGSSAFYTHPLRELGGTPGRVGNISRELPLDIIVAPWAIDSIDLLTDGMDDPLVFSMWYMLLNWGHRIGICAYNDACFDRAGTRANNSFNEPIAYHRTYVKVADEVSSRALLDGIRAGRTIATSGPVVLVELDDKEPGHVFPTGDTARTLRIRAWGAPGYHDPLEAGTITRIQVIHNGDLHQEWSFADGSEDHVEVTAEITEQSTGWYIVRVEGSIDDQFAITSPFYFEGPEYQAPETHAATVQATVVDAETGRPLDGRLEFVAFDKEQVEVCQTQTFSDGSFNGQVAGDLRLRAVVEGYHDMILSPILDFPEIYREILAGIRREDLADPAYYVKLREALDRVELSFAMNPLQ